MGSYWLNACIQSINWLISIFLFKINKYSLKNYSKDQTNLFVWKFLSLIQVIPGSGHGWDRFHLFSENPDGGSLISLQPFDYEDPNQREGFKFKVQVSDKVSEQLSKMTSQYQHINYFVYPLKPFNNKMILFLKYILITL